MAFLDNSGDIILDAVLTDTGRMRLAKGDGTFKIVKFALADDEVDYSLYDSTHVSGSAYFDLNILITPILEAFTNNTSAMKSKLISIPRNNLLYLPVVKLLNGTDYPKFQQYTSLSSHVVVVDSDTVTQWKNSNQTLPLGVLDGYQPDASDHRIRTDQGLDTNDIASTLTIDQDLKETQYIIEMDDRLGTLLNDDTNDEMSVSYIDDDSIASYYVSFGDGEKFVEDIGVADPNNLNNPPSALQGPRGTKIQFKIGASLELVSSTYLFDTLGSTNTGGAPNSGNYKYIDTNVRVTGATTGASIDIPIRYVKKTT